MGGLEQNVMRGEHFQKVQKDPLQLSTKEYFYENSVFDFLLVRVSLNACVPSF